MIVRTLLLVSLVLTGSVWAADQQPPAPVSVAKVTKRDVPTFLEGLGTVNAYNSVLIRSQVDGQLVRLSVKEGDEVKAGDLLFEIDARLYQAAYDQAVAKKAQDQALLANAKLDLQRYTGLADKKYIARQQLDTTQALVSQLQAAVAADQAAIDSAKVTLGYTQIRSPISGRVGIRNVDIGNIVHANDSAGLVTVAQLQPIYVVFSLPEEQLQSVLRAQTRQPLKVAAVSRDGRVRLDEGALDVVDNQIDQTSGMVKLRALLPNRNRTLWPGQFVNARLALEGFTDALTVPADAIQRGPENRFVYVVKDDGTAELRVVESPSISDGVAVVTRGLKEGETVVVSGQYRVQPGGRLEIRTSKAAP